MQQKGLPKLHQNFRELLKPLPLPLLLCNGDVSLHFCQGVCQAAPCAFDEPKRCLSFQRLHSFSAECFIHA